MVMCLQLNRMEYLSPTGKGIGETIKHKHKVQIEPTLYVDRFLMANKEKSTQISNHVAKLREQIHHLERSINEYTHFGGSQNDIRQMFDLLGTFLSDQNSKSRISDWKPIDGLKSYHPFNDQISSGDKSKASDTVSMLKKYHGQLSKQVDEMES